MVAKYVVCVPQVDGKGYIVSEEWVLDSYSRKKKLPWREYRMGRAKSPPNAKADDEKVYAFVVVCA